VFPLLVATGVAMWQAPRIRGYESQPGPGGAPPLSAVAGRPPGSRSGTNRTPRRCADCRADAFINPFGPEKKVPAMAPRLTQMDEQVPFQKQLEQDTGPVVLINTFNVAPGDVPALLDAWADDAAWMKRQPGYIHAQLHRGIAGSTTIVNVAVWESARALGQALGSPEFQARIAHYPDSTTTSPHVFQRVAVPGICVD
jgi:quinol monooxygenase YgiN